MAGGVELGQGGAHGDGLARPHFAGHHADGSLVDAPRNAGHGLGMPGVGVQHGGGQVLAERHAAKAPMAAQAGDAHPAASPSVPGGAVALTALGPQARITDALGQFGVGPAPRPAPR